MKYADVIIDISLEQLDKTYQYAIPESLSEAVTVGTKVNVPFGKGNRAVTGYVLSVTEEPSFAAERTKDILSVVRGAISLEDRAIKMACFLRDHFGGTLNESLKTVLPVRQSVKEKTDKILKLTENIEKAEASLLLAKKRNYRAKERLLSALLERKEIPFPELTERYHISKSTIESLQKEGSAVLSETVAYRNPAMISEKKQKATLNREQQEAVDAILLGRAEADPKPFYLFGVTGSGKSEVYLEVIEHVIAEGKQAIVLIPEIALTYQTVKRFTERFGERASVLHSRLSAGERYDQYIRAKKGEIDVMIGPRSALFTPFERLSLIVIDEEQENAYKSEGTPKYHARDTAEYLAKLTGATLLLGSATPSLEAYQKATEGSYRMLRLKKRAKEAVLPSVEIVDLRQELQEGNRSMFSRSLQEQMKECLAKEEQIMLFLNRRGYAGAVSCRLCGKAIKCPHCDISLTYHRGGSLMCHYCGYTAKQPKICPECGSTYIGLFGTGTEKVEEAVHKMFPEARVLRMDADTTKAKGGHDKIVSAFAKGEADVLIGTQMIVKGHDFPNVTLVGIIAADLSLYTGDFRAAERTFCLLAQAAGRAGRASKKGHVVIQTYQPAHYSITNAVGEQYEAFFRQEMSYRRLMAYPPAGHMLAILFMAEKEEQSEKAAVRLASFLKDTMKGKDSGVLLIGPAKAGISKINDTYRYVLYLKSEEEQKLQDLCKKTYEKREVLQQELSCRIQYDFDPYNGY